MDVALSTVASQDDFRRRFDHVVDNFGNTFGFVADWFAFARWRRAHPSATRRSGGGAYYQSRNRPASRLAG